MQAPLEVKAVGCVYRLGVSLQSVQPYWIPEIVCAYLRGGGGCMMRDPTGGLAAASVATANTAK